MHRTTSRQGNIASLVRSGRFAPALVVLLLTAQSQAAELAVKALRVWPSHDYTRMTFESRSPIEYEISVIDEPRRVVLDLQNVDYDSLQVLLTPKSFDQDPFIRGVRIGRYKPGVTRLVLDLRADVHPQIFALKPVAQYEDRLVLDLYPLTPPDPLADLIKREEMQSAPIAPPGPAPRGMAELKSSGELSPSTQAPPATAAARPDGTLSTLPPPASATARPDGTSSWAQPPADLSTAPAPLRPPPATSNARPSSIAPPMATGPGAAPAPRSSPPALGMLRPRRLPRTVTIVVDAGHGGEDPGARGRHGTYEKDVTLAIARRLKALIDQQPQMRAILTRDSDFFIPLAGRVEKAHRARADLFVSVHADSFIRPNARGSSVFALSERGASSVAASWLARQENNADLIGGVNMSTHDRRVAQTLLDLSQTAAISDSLALGNQVLSELGGINRLHKPYVEQAAFAVLKSPDIPSILVETAFISNPDEEKRLKDRAYQQRVAHAILTGVQRYFARNPPLSRQNMVANELPRR